MGARRTRGTAAVAYADPGRGRPRNDDPAHNRRGAPTPRATLVVFVLSRIVITVVVTAFIVRLIQAI